MVVKSLVSENCDENEIIDGIKDMVNMGKLIIGSSKCSINSSRQYKTFHERTIKLPVEETVAHETAAHETANETATKEITAAENESTGTESINDKVE